MLFLMGRISKTLILLASLGLAACLPQATHTAAPPGASDNEFHTDNVPEAENTKGSGTETPPPDVTANQAGPGGSMPSGTLAPPPLIPLNMDYKAEGTYCRFEGERSQAMIWGRIYLKTSGSEVRECLDECQGTQLRISYFYQGADAVQDFRIDDAPNFRFVVDIDDLKQFSLVLMIQPSIALIGQETPPPKGFFVDVSGFQPYTVDGSAAYCPSHILMKGMYTKPSAMPIGPPLEMKKITPQN
jgi:hypothetical protein